MTTKLYRVGQAEVTIRDPEVPVEKSRVRIQAQQRTIDGSLKQHIVAIKWRWRLTWDLLTTAEYGTLVAELIRQEAMTFKPPDTASTYTVVMTSDVEIANNEFDTFDVSVTLEEV